MECCIHHESTSDTKLVELSSVDSWNKLLAAAEIRKCEEILNLKDKEHVDGYPHLKYHKSCRSLFDNQRLLHKMKKKESGETVKRRSSIRLQSDVEKRECDKLPTHCIFCEKVKYVLKSRSKEKLLSCCETRADVNIRQCSKQKNYQRIMALCSDELISKEAMYHFSCYRDYTRDQYQKQDRYTIMQFVDFFY